GIREDVLVDLLTDETKVGDVYLLCSDGLTGMVSDDQILEVVSTTSDLDEACSSLVQRANFFGGNDNITVVLARVEDGEPMPPSIRKMIGEESTDQGGGAIQTQPPA